MVINILHSIGDILFCEPIYRYYWKKDGVKPTVIIRDHLLWLQNYIESADFLGASKWDGDIDNCHMTDDYIPLRFANQIYRGYDLWDNRDLENCMLDKYRLVMLPEDLWKTLEIKLTQPDGNVTIFATATPGPTFAPPTKWYLINEHSQAGSVKIDLDKKDGRIVYMESQPESTVIDWAYRIKQAEENHHVSTCTFFIMQAIKNKFPSWNAPCYIYPRPNEDGLRGISQLKPDFNLIRVEK